MSVFIDGWRIRWALAAIAALVISCSGGPASDREIKASAAELCTGGGLVSNDADYTAAPGATITWTASASCVNPNPQYQFWMQDTGGTWSIVQAWSTTATFPWNTTSLPDGTYNWQVWVREAGGSNYETYAGRAFMLASTTSCGSVSSSASPANTTSIGETVTITSSAGGCTPEYQVWHLAPGGAWEIVQAYGASSMYNWGTSGAPAGTHSFQIWARGQGSSASYEAYTGFGYVLATPCTAVSGTFNPVTSAEVGTAVSLTAVGTCGGTPQYRFWRLPPGGAWSVVQDWTTNGVYNWDTSGADPGTYQYQIWVRNSGATASYEAYSGLSYTLVAAGPACTGATLSPAPSGPASAGTPVVFTASSSTCSSPNYEFWILPPAGSWSIAQAWGSSATYNWNTTALGSGTYYFQVWARKGGSTGSYEVYASSSFVISP